LLNAQGSSQWSFDLRDCRIDLAPMLSPEVPFEMHTSPGIATRPQRVLIVDPDVDTHELYHTYLQPRGCVVEHAEDGPAALAKALTGAPDVIVTEARVPGIDGVTLCGLLRNDPATRSVPIVLLTADARPSLQDAASRAGATRVLVKPCLPDALWRELQQIHELLGACVERPAIERRIARGVVRDRQRHVTATPPAAPPTLHCPDCAAILAYDRSQVGAVTAKFPEQWDYYHCPAACGTFQYRHRTRSVTRSAA
jgi:two-component system cell cycle response regulator DivK